MHQEVNLDELRRGSGKEWRKLFDLYFMRLLDDAFRMVADQADAEDVVQLVFMKVWRSRHRLPQIRDPAAYLRVAVQNQARNLIRSRRLAGPHVDFDMAVRYLPDERVDDPSDSILTDELGERITHATRRLTPAQRAVFDELRRDPDSSSRDIAARRACSHKNVLATIKRMRRVLHPGLKQYVATDPAAPSVEPR